MPELYRVVEIGPIAGVRYRFYRTPTSKVFEAVLPTGDVEKREIREAESMGAVMLELMSKMQDTTFFNEPAIEAAFRAGYLVGMWEVKYGNTK